MSLPDAPNTLREKYYSVMAGQNDADILPDIETAPSTENRYLDYIARNGGGGGGDVTKEYVDEQDAKKTDKVTSAISGNFAGLDENGNLTDSNKSATDFATASDMSDVQAVIPSTATTQNKLATVADVTGEDISSTSTTSPLTDSADGMVQGLTIYGRSHKSKNLLDPDNPNNTMYGITEVHTSEDLTLTVTEAGSWNQYVYDIHNNTDIRGKTVNLSVDDVIQSSARCDWAIFMTQYIGDTKTTVGSIYPSRKSYSVTLDNATTRMSIVVLVSQSRSAQVGDYITVKKLQLEFGTEQTTYEPYFEGIHSVGDDGLTVTTANSDNTVTTSAEFTTALPLRGVSDTVRDKLICTAEKKQVETVCGEVDLGTLNYTYNSTYNVFITSDIDYALSDVMLCAEYEYRQDTQSWLQLQNKQFAAPYGIQIAFKNTDYTDPTAFKAAMSGVMLVYKLAEPVTTPLTDAEISAFRALRTFGSTTNITITNEPEFELDYLKNTENGQAVAGIQTDLQGQINGLAIKTLTYTGTGTTTNSITFPDKPLMVLGITQHEMESPYQDYHRSIIPFVYDSRSSTMHCQWVKNIDTSSPQYRGSMLYYLTINGNTMTWTAQDAAQAFNLENIEYTVYYI